MEHHYEHARLDSLMPSLLVTGFSTPIAKTATMKEAFCGIVPICRRLDLEFAGQRCFEISWISAVISKHHEDNDRIPCANLSTVVAPEAEDIFSRGGLGC